MKNGFYTALGTPLDEAGYLVEESFIKHVEDQVAAGAVGLLVMGSMGNQSGIRNSEYAKVAKIAVETIKGRCPVFVGVMDNSISRVMDRINSLKGLDIDGVVATAPFYYAPTQNAIKCFFECIAQKSSYPLYMYDLPSVTKVKISIDSIEYLMGNNNIKGIKTGDLMTVKSLMLHPSKRDDFHVMFSGLDIFDVAYKYGIKKSLDGMFACTAPIAKRMYESFENGSFETATKCLEDILLLRNTFVEVGVFEGFSYAMNVLGFNGIFAPDYNKINAETMEKVRVCMQQIGLI